MIYRSLALILALGYATLVVAAERRNAPSVSPIRDPDKEGLDLANRLRSSAPGENSRVTGSLEVRARDGKARSIPVVSEVVRSPTNWVIRYETSSPELTSETLSIQHAAGRPNVYEHQKGSKRSTQPSLTQPFADSDFWVMDLGLEFLQWPTQRVIRAEMSRNRACRILESLPSRPIPEGYGRVLSWVDLETGGILQAEAYDHSNKLLKKFSLGSFKKIAGEWQLRDMRIRNLRTQQQTELKFDLNSGPP